MTNKEIIDVVTAAEAGKAIERCYLCHVNLWSTAISTEPWDFVHFNYRVKPEPREWWLNVYSSQIGGAFESKFEADHHCTAYRVECIHVREVIE